MNVEKTTNDLINWIKKWFDENGPNCNAVIGISGGKDSSIIAELCARALGPDRVLGVLIPNGIQKDINDSIEVCKYIGIRYITVNIAPAVEALKKEIGFELSSQSETNLPARVRMTTLYAISQSNNGRVVGTCNASENYVGYFTRYGDGASDVEPIGNLTVSEVIEIGDFLGLPYHLVHKTPDDGLPNSNTDEEKFGFTYSELDKYIREGVEPEGMCNNDQSVTKLDKIKPLYNPELTIDENIEIFKENGIKCCRETVKRLRKDLGLTKHYRPRKKAN